jgi:hypothetical protein
VTTYSSPPGAIVHNPSYLGKGDVAQAILALTLVAVVYGLILIGLPAGVSWSPDEGGKIIQLLSIHWEGGPAYDLPYPGRSLDPHLRFLPHLFILVEGQKLYSWWPLWFPLLTRPFYTLLGPIGLYVLPAAAGLMASWMAYRLVRRKSPSLAPLAIPVVGLATPIAFYSVTYWEHTLAVASGLTALLLLEQDGKHRTWSRLTAGLTLSLAVTLRLEMLILLAAVLSALVWRALSEWRRPRLKGVPAPNDRRRGATVPDKPSRTGGREIGRILIVLVGFGIGLCAPVGFNLTMEGSVLGRRYQDQPARQAPTVLGYARAAGLDVLPAFLVGSSAHQGPDLPGGLRWGAALLSTACLFLPWWPSRWPTIIRRVLYTSLLAVSVVIVAWQGDYRSFQGMIIAPHLVFAAWGLRTTTKGKSLALRLVGATTVSYLALFLVASATFGWRGAGGLQWGPRYALLLFPLSVVLSLDGLARMRASCLVDHEKQFLTACYAFLLLPALLFQLRGMVNLASDKSQLATWEESLSNLPQDHLVTDLPWLPTSLPLRYETTAWFLVEDAQGLEDWLGLAEKDGVEGLCYISFAPLEAHVSSLPVGWRLISEEELDGMHVQCFEW